MIQSLRNKRNIVRHRRQGTVPTLLWVTPAGAKVTVRTSPFNPKRAQYGTHAAVAYGEWPPAASVVKEINSWR